jgi:hypothetical protein
MKHALIVAALLFAGCGKKSETAAGPSCADAVEKALAAMPGGPGAGDEIKGKLRGIYTKHCTDDKWSADAIKCYANDVKDMSSMKACREKLTPEQSEALMGEVRATMMGAAGSMGGGGPMHGGGPSAPPAGTGPAGGGPPPSTGSDSAPAPAGSGS